MNVHARLVACGGRAPGFDALRLLLAVSVFLWHSFYVCTPRDAPAFRDLIAHPLVLPALRAILPMFFFLGGFLVAGSAYRLRSTPSFLIHRAARIVPALVVEVTASAVILGGLLTTLPPLEYYTHNVFFAYFQNIVGRVHFDLPGVFLDHPSTKVNVNLWTLPPDFEGYAIMAVAMATGVLYRATWFRTLFIGGTVVLVARLPTLAWGESGSMFVAPFLLIYSFLLGAFVWIEAKRIPLRPALAVASIAGLALFNRPETTFLGVLSACYLCLYIGFLDLRRFPLINRGDYSYGVYLYGFPIQQAIWHAVPSARWWLPMFLLAFPVTLLFAAFSWHAVEVPLLAVRRRFDFGLRSPSPARRE